MENQHQSKADLTFEKNTQNCQNAFETFSNDSGEDTFPMEPGFGGWDRSVFKIQNDHFSRMKHADNLELLEKIQEDKNVPKIVPKTKFDLNFINNSKNPLHPQFQQTFSSTKLIEPSNVEKPTLNPEKSITKNPEIGRPDLFSESKTKHSHSKLKKRKKSHMEKFSLWDNDTSKDSQEKKNRNLIRKESLADDKKPRVSLRTSLVKLQKKYSNKRNFQNCQKQNGFIQICKNEAESNTNNNKYLSQKTIMNNSRNKANIAYIEKNTYDDMKNVFKMEMINKRNPVVLGILKETQDSFYKKIDDSRKNIDRKIHNKLEPSEREYESQYMNVFKKDIFFQSEREYADGNMGSFSVNSSDKNLTYFGKKGMAGTEYPLEQNKNSHFDQGSAEFGNKGKSITFMTPKAGIGVSTQILDSNAEFDDGNLLYGNHQTSLNRFACISRNNLNQTAYHKNLYENYNRTQHGSLSNLGQTTIINSSSCNRATSNENSKNNQDSLRNGFFFNKENHGSQKLKFYNGTEINSSPCGTGNSNITKLGIKYKHKNISSTNIANFSQNISKHKNNLVFNRSNRPDEDLNMDLNKKNEEFCHDQNVSQNYNAPTSNNVRLASITQRNISGQFIKDKTKQSNINFAKAKNPNDNPNVYTGAQAVKLTNSDDENKLSENYIPKNIPEDPNKNPNQKKARLHSNFKANTRPKGLQQQQLALNENGSYINKQLSDSITNLKKFPKRIEKMKLQEQVF